MLSSRLNAFVSPISHTTATASPITWLRDELDVRPGGEDDRGRGALRGELRERREATKVVDEARREDDGDRDPDAEERSARLERADRRGASRARR